MDNSEFTTILIAAAVGATVKEVFSVLIRSGKSSVARLATHALPWIVKNILLIDLCLTIGMFLLLLFAMLWTPYPNAVASHFHMKFFILLGMAIMWQGISIKPTWQRYWDHSKARKPDADQKPLTKSKSSRAAE
jgi:hypothetical protein